MTGNAPKEIGNSCKCFKCGNPIFCRGKEYQGKTNPQWQNNDGKSHYDKDGGCKVVSGGTATVANTTYTSNVQPETKVVWGKLDEPSADQLLLVSGLREVRSLAYDFTKEGHPELSENTNLFGQIVNANISHLLTLALIKATKESK